MVDVDALIAEAHEQIENAEPVTEKVMIGSHLAVVEMRVLPSDEWLLLVATHPPRKDSPRDAEFGYNIDAVTAAYPRVKVTVDGEQLQLWRDSEDGRSREWRWPQIASALSAPDRTKLAFVVWGMNEWDPKQRTAVAGKASAGARRKKRSSPASSA